MADVYINPLDVAPVRGSRSVRDPNLPALPQKHTAEEIRAFADFLAQQSAQREPTPVLTNKALSIPNQDSMKSVAAPDIRAQQTETASANIGQETSTHHEPAADIPSTKPSESEVKSATIEMQPLSQPIAPDLASPAAENLRELMQRDESFPANETRRIVIDASDHGKNLPPAEDQAPVDDDAAPILTSGARPSSDSAPSVAVNDVKTSRLESEAIVHEEAAFPTAYTVRRGDTLSEIIAGALRARGVSYNTRDLYRMVNQVADLNGIRNPNLIFPGQAVDLSAVSGQILARGGPAALEQTPNSAPSSTPLSDRGYQPPLHGPITSNFGMRVHPIRGVEHHHSGIDIAAPEGTPIQPVKAGVVVFSGERSGYGQMVELDHGDATSSLYAHLSERLVREGDRVELSMPLGLVGQTGTSTGPHLHLEIHNQGRPIDPLSVLPENYIALR